MQGSNRNEQLEKESSENGRERQKQQDASLQTSARRSSVGRLAFIIALILLVIAGGTIGAALLFKNTNTASTGNHSNPGNAALAANANGTVAFIDQPGSSGHSDGIKLVINSLQPAPTGFQYYAWLVDTTHRQQVIALGTLVEKDQVFALDSSGNGTNFLGAGNEIEITLEQGTVHAPTGKALLSAVFPSQAFVYIRHLLVAFPGAPGNTGLLVGLFGQAQLLNSIAQQLPGFAAQHNTQAIQCTAQSILDVIEGKGSAHYNQLPADCAAQHFTSSGDGFGLLGPRGYIANAEAQVLLASTQSDSTIDMRVHSRHVDIALEDMREWLITLDQDALNLFNNPANTTKVQEIVTLANHDLYGVDLNGDGSIDYVPGEAGATIAYVHGQYMAGLVLAPG